MADNYLITGYCGKNHVTAENDRGIHAGIFGVGRYVLPVGKQFKAEYIGNNTVRIYDGKLVDNGAAAGIPAGEYVDLVVSTASQGMNRNDLIVFQYSQDSSTMIESGTFIVIQGTETSGAAADPELQQEDLLSGSATIDQMALWRIPVSTGTFSEPVQMFEVSKSLDKAGSGKNIVVDAISGDGVSYTATVEDLEELYNGLEITIIPNVVSTTTAPTLNVNGLGAKPIRLTLSSNNTTMVQPDDNGYYAAGRPITLMFDSKYLSTGVWKVTCNQRPAAQDLYGTTPVPKGGTGLGSVTKGNFLVGNGTEPMQEMTMQQLVTQLSATLGGAAYDWLGEIDGEGSHTISGLDQYEYIILVTNCGCFWLHNWGETQTITITATETNGIHIFSRDVTPNGNSIDIGDCTDVCIEAGDPLYFSVEVQNGYIVPYAVYGVRGMVWVE